MVRGFAALALALLFAAIVLTMFPSVLATVLVVVKAVHP